MGCRGLVGLETNYQKPATRSVDLQPSDLFQGGMNLPALLIDLDISSRCDVCIRELICLDRLYICWVMKKGQVTGTGDPVIGTTAVHTF